MSPLSGKKIVITRAPEQSGELASRLQALGAEVIELPMIEIQPAADYRPLDRAIAQLSSYHWIIFTSANGVRFFMQRLQKTVIALADVPARICAIGPGTRRSLEKLGVEVDLMPEEYVAEGLVEAFGKYDLRGKRILLPRAAVARDVVPFELESRGAVVDVVEAYRTVIPEGTRSAARLVFAAARRPDWVTFTSPSTISNFVEAAGTQALKGVRVASIGPVTSTAARKAGVPITVEAKVFSLDGLVEAIVEAEG